MASSTSKLDPSGPWGWFAASFSTVFFAIGYMAGFAFHDTWYGGLFVFLFLFMFWVRAFLTWRERRGNKG